MVDDATTFCPESSPIPPLARFSLLSFLSALSSAMGVSLMPTTAPHSDAFSDDLYEYARRLPDSDASWYISTIHHTHTYTIQFRLHRSFSLRVFVRFYGLAVVVFGLGLSLIYLSYLLYST